MRDNVLVLMAAYNGEQFIEEQLSSIFDSKFSGRLSVVVGLDPSTDNTRHTLMKSPLPFQLVEHGSPSGSAAQNFSRLMTYALTEHPQCVDYVLFSDQDDYWCETKIQIGFDRIREIEAVSGPEQPILIFTDSEVVKQDLTPIADSFWRHERLDPEMSQSYRRLIVQNVGQGCTFIFNKALLEKVKNIPVGVRMHDHWLMLTASLFGEIHYLDTATMKYRQHDDNVLGSQGMSLYSSIQRALFARTGIKRAITGAQKQAGLFLEAYGAELGPREALFFKEFAMLENKNFIARKLFCMKNGIRMSNLYRTVGFYIFI